MKCCGYDLGKGEPFVLIRYWCDKCKTEHLCDAKEMTEYVASLARSSSDTQQLPDLL